MRCTCASRVRTNTTRDIFSRSRLRTLLHIQCMFSKSTWICLMAAQWWGASGTRPLCVRTARTPAIRLRRWGGMLGGATPRFVGNPNIEQTGIRPREPMHGCERKSNFLVHVTFVPANIERRCMVPDRSAAALKVFKIVPYLRTLVCSRSMRWSVSVVSMAIS